MKCLDCPLKYIGQTGRTLHTGYEVHIQAIRNNNSNSGFSNYRSNTEHMGPIQIQWTENT
jgi:hypothetical protein